MNRQEISTFVLTELKKFDENPTEEIVLDKTGMDSLDRLDLLMSVEDAFNIEINDFSSAEFTGTVKQIIDEVERLCSLQNPTK